MSSLLEEVVEDLRSLSREEQDARRRCCSRSLGGLQDDSVDDVRLAGGKLGPLNMGSHAAQVTIGAAQSRLRWKTNEVNVSDELRE